MLLFSSPSLSSERGPCSTLLLKNKDGVHKEGDTRMFDPTVFDNLKTVIEGAVYDLDLEGVIAVIERHDFIDLAHLSRMYEIAFQLRGQLGVDVSCKVELTMDLEQMAGELLQTLAAPGCKLTIMFTMPLIREETVCPLVEEVLQKIWGSNRSISQTLRRDYKSGQGSHEIKVQFGRLIDETHIDDLQEMLPYMLKSLHELKLLAK
jgi:hypothetical protein